MEQKAYTFQTFRVGSQQFAVRESEIATIADWRWPTPLPHSPPAIMGIVSLLGRMLTVLDLGKITDGDSAVNGPPRHIIALRGDEQLALAVHDVAAKLETSPIEGSDSSAFTHGVLEHKGEQIAIVNVKGLFSSAIQGRERRQRRF